MSKTTATEPCPKCGTTTPDLDAMPHESAYHWRNDCWFIRQANGDVSIQHRLSDDKYYDFGTIPADEWVSIVHAMAAPGARYATVRAAITEGTDG